MFFGANDAVLPPGDQYVPLEKYVQNLKAIIQHPVVRYGGTKIVLLTPPPVNEYQLTAFDLSKGVTPLSRSANNTKLYADACREVGKSLHVAIADIWSAFMREAGWVEGQPIAGSKEIPENPKLASLLIDGQSSLFSKSPWYLPMLISTSSRPPFLRGRIQSHVRRGPQSHPRDLP